VNTKGIASWILLACTAGGALAACSSSSSSSSKPSPSPSAKASATSPATAADEKAITANWIAFFNPKSAVTRRVDLLQDGSTFASVIKAQAGSSLASTASATVTKVKVITPSQADVTYNILVAGTPALKNQTGVAVYQDGTWKVGVASFCGLLALENGGSTSSLPSACKAAT